MIILGGDYSDDIYKCKIEETSTNQTTHEWKLNDNLKMPHSVRIELFYDISLFGDVVFVFYLKALESDDNDIECNDIWAVSI